MDKSKKIESLAQSQVAYEYVSAVPFKDAVRKIESKPSPKLRFDSFEETEESSIYSLVVADPVFQQSYGYQLRLKTWNFGEQSHVSLHQVDYHHVQIDYNWKQIIIYISALILFTAAFFMWRWQGTINLPIIAVICVLLILIFLTANNRIGILWHSPRLESLILEQIKAELGEAPDDNIIDEVEAQETISRSSYESQA